MKYIIFDKKLSVWFINWTHWKLIEQNRASRFSGRVAC